jgi:tRNA A-37 threonylcarbamoyl transferase component Bud32
MLPPKSGSVQQAGAAVPGYEIAGELGRGGMGVVYKARQTGLNRTVALKMILAGEHASAADLARFRVEAEAVARIQHPNIVQIHEIGDRDGRPFFSLEFCDGGSLAAKLDGTPWVARRAAELVETLARAVQAAHDRQVVHRDLKPANVLLAADGTPKIADFGLAKRLDASAGQTASGAILGTPSYMAPEQANGSKHVGTAADIYALGAILYELLTGRPPFKAPTALDTVMQVVSDEPARPRALQSKIPRELEAVCLKCLAKLPSSRYASAGALADDLAAWLDGRPVAARPLGLANRAWAWIKVHPWLAGALLANGVGGIAFAAATYLTIGADNSSFWVVCATFFVPFPVLLVFYIAFDRREKALRTAAMRAQSVADEVPAAVLSLYVSRRKLLRWMIAGGLVGGILGYALVPTNGFDSEMFFIYYLAGAGVAACVVAGVRSK